MNKILITGACGFIGYHLTGLLQNEYKVIGIDSLNNAYDPKLKELRLKNLNKLENFEFFNINLSEKKELEKISTSILNVETVIHLGARAGVRQSYLEPEKYIEDNTTASTNLAFVSKELGVRKFIIASTSSIYGDTGTQMATEDVDELVDPPSIYAATKQFGETMVKNIFSTGEHIIQIPRFFTVYGPFGRPDMSILRFVHWIENGEEVLIYGDGEQKRSFTYVSDIVNGLSKLIDYEESGTFNFGSNKTWSLNNVIEKIENKLDSKANINFKERAFRDVDIVLPNLKKSESKLGWTPLVDLDAGLDKTITWYKKYKEELRNVKFKYEYEK